MRKLFTWLLLAALACVGDVAVDQPTKIDTVPRVYSVAPSLLDPGFEQGGAAWAKVGFSGRTLTNLEAHTGQTSLAVAASATSSREVYQGTAVTPGEVYEVSSWMKVTGVTASSRVLVNWYNQVISDVPGTPIPANALVRQDFAALLTGASTAWTFSVDTLLAPPGAVWARVLLYQGAETDGAGTTWFDDITFGKITPDTVTPPPPPPPPVQGFVLRYLGGSADEQARDVVTDAQGFVYVVGGTASNNFPTTAGAADRTHDNSANGTAKPFDAFVTKLDMSGNIVASTFVGGPGYDRAYAIEVAPDGDLVIGGRTGGGLPATQGTFSPTFMGGPTGTGYGRQDPFVCKLSNDLSAVRWCTYGGAAGTEYYRDIDVDASGNIWTATVLDAPIPSAWVAGGAQASFVGGGLDGAIYKISPSGQLLAGTYVAGSGSDANGPSIRADHAGNVWIYMTSGSADLPTFEQAFHGATDGYLAKYNSTLTSVLYATYLGGSGSEASETHNLAIGPDNTVYVGAITYSPDIQVSPTALQSARSGVSDAFIVRVGASGGIQHITLLGGPEGDFIQGIVVGMDGRVYAAGGGFSPYYTVPFSGTQASISAALVILTSDLLVLDYVKGWGGSNEDLGRGVAVSPAGSVWVTGTSMSTNLPVTLGGTFKGGTLDGLVARLP